MRKLTEKQLQKKIDRADRREMHDDHLTDEERQKLVNQYKEVYPNEKLDEEITEAFMQVLGW
jgi:preprotein translocase subunit SecA